MVSRALLLGLVLAAAVIAGAPAGCVDSPSGADCRQFTECGTCTMQEGCAFCLETNVCMPSDGQCSGDIAMSPDMCQ